MTMIRAGETLRDRCEEVGLRVNLRYVDLWVSDFLPPNTHLVVEMFPYFKNLSIPVISGRPFLSRSGEDELLAELVAKVREITANDRS
jgi:hypothetical protein